MAHMKFKQESDSDQLDAVFFALASESRRRILDALKQEPGCNVNRVCEYLEKDIGRFAVMKHLATLEAAGLVIAERSGASACSGSTRRRSSGSTSAGPPSSAPTGQRD